MEDLIWGSMHNVPREVKLPHAIDFPGPAVGPGEPSHSDNHHPCPIRTSLSRLRDDRRTSKIDIGDLATHFTADQEGIEGLVNQPWECHFMRRIQETPQSVYASSKLLFDHPVIKNWSRSRSRLPPRQSHYSPSAPSGIAESPAGAAASCRSRGQ